MKKVKVMLLSLLVFAVVGGALAFKAKFDQEFCTAPAVALGGGVFVCPVFCPNYVQNSTIVASATGNRWCTVTSGGKPNNPCVDEKLNVLHCVNPIVGLTADE